MPCRVILELLQSHEQELSNQELAKIRGHIDAILLARTQTQQEASQYALRGNQLPYSRKEILPRPSTRADFAAYYFGQSKIPPANTGTSQRPTYKAAPAGKPLAFPTTRFAQSQGSAGYSAQPVACTAGIGSQNPASPLQMPLPQRYSTGSYG